MDQNKVSSQYCGLFDYRDGLNAKLKTNPYIIEIFSNFSPPNTMKSKKKLSKISNTRHLIRIVHQQ